MNRGASRPPAVTGSITIDNSGMPTMENPPPNAPFMKQIRNTPAKATRIVAIVRSIGSSHPSISGWSAGRSDEAVDRRLDLGAHEADVAQCAVVELVQACDGGAADEIAGDPIATGAEQPRECAEPLRNLR